MSEQTYKKIEGKTDANAEYIFNSQKHQRTTKDFSHINDNHVKKCKKYDEIREMMAKDADTKKDLLCGFEKFKVSVKGKAVGLENNDGFYEPTEWAATQLCNTLGLPSTYYHKLMKGDDDDRQLLKSNLENGLRKFDKKKEMLFRVDTKGQMRALLTNRYSIVPNNWFIERVFEIIPDGLVSKFYGDSDSFNGDVFIPDSLRQEQDSDYCGLVSIFNSEIGNKRIGCKPALLRTCCWNSNYWGLTYGENLNKVHKGTIDLNFLAKDIYTNITEQIPLVDVGIKLLLDTRTFVYKDGSIRPVLAQFIEDVGLNKKKATDFMIGYTVETQSAEAKSLFGLINGLTRAAQSWKGGEFDISYPFVAKVLDDSEKYWNSLTGRAKHKSAKEVDKILAIAI